MQFVLVREIVIVFLVALIGGYIALRLKQPALVGYLLGGMILSLPFFSKLIDFDVSRGVAQFGVALLLFATGVEFPISRLLSLKKSAIWGCILQMVLFLALTTLIFTRFGFSYYESLFLGAAFSNSATVLVLQILESKLSRDIKTSDVVIGWLLIQDVSIIVIAVLLNSIPTNASLDVYAVLEAIAKAAIFLIVSILLGKSIIPKIFNALSKTDSFEILLVLSFVFCLIVAYFAEAIGLSYTFGAFLAGIMISESFVNHEIFSEIRPLRDLFSIVFFVTLGTLLSPAFLVQNILKIVLLVLGLSFLKFLTSFISILIFDKQSRKAFIVSLILMQGGEFAFILAQMGYDNSWIDLDFYSLVIITSILSILITPFLIDRSDDWFYSIREFVRKRSFKLYRLFFVKYGGTEPVDQPDMSNHVVIAGFGRVGSYIGRALDRVGIPYVVIDSNSQTVDFCKQRGIRVIYGDASSIDILEKADVERAFAVVIALPIEGDAEIVASSVKKLNPNVKIIARSHEPVEHLRLKSKGVTISVEPEFEAAVSISKKILNFMGKSSFDIAKYLKKSRRRQRSRRSISRIAASKTPIVQ